MSVIGYFVWQRINQSEIPPIYDALSYYSEAKYFWKNVFNGFPENPMNVGPALRPPGTVLMSYPFGFDKDYHWFFFRSVFLPFLLWVITIMILVWPKQVENKQRSYWNVLWSVLLLGPMPFFFTFEYNYLSFIGMVDGFLATVSALAIALAIKSIEKQSMKWLIAAVLIAAICPFIKPTGCIVLLLIAIFWSGIVLNDYIKNKADKSIVKFFWKGSVLFLVTGLIVLYVVFSSVYLGQGSFSKGQESSSQFGLQSDNIPLAYKILAFLVFMYTVLGPQILIYTVAFTMLIKRYRNSIEIPLRLRILIFFSICFFIIGVLILFIFLNPLEIRHFLPFFLIGFVPLIYYANQLANLKTIYIASGLKKLFTIGCILPALNLILLLSVLNPNSIWQKISGVKMDISIGDHGVAFAKQFLLQLRKQDHQATVYVTSAHVASFFCYGEYDKMIHPMERGFDYILPNDWIKPRTLNLAEIVFKSDHILFKSIPLQLQNKNPAFQTVNYLYEEINVLDSFLNALTPEQGLSKVDQLDSFNLSKITNKMALKNAFEKFIAAKKWSPLFLKTNNITSKGWQLFNCPIDGIPNGLIKDTATTSISVGNIEIVNDKINVPDSVRVKDVFSIGGWLAFDPNKGIPADQVFVSLIAPDGVVQYYPVDNKSSPDIVTGFKQPALNNVRFRAFIDLSALKGMYTMQLAMAYKGKLINCPKLSRMIIIE